MASSSSSSASSAALSLLALAFVCSSLLNNSEAREFLVGGKPNSWQMPSFASQSLNNWAEDQRFNVGDKLVWKFDNVKDSVLQVTKEDYESCNVSGPVVSHKGGNVTVILNRPGSFFFISGVRGRCEKGEKMVVVVLSTHQSTPSPAPAPFDSSSLAPAPISGSTAIWKRKDCVVFLGGVLAVWLLSVA